MNRDLSTIFLALLPFILYSTLYHEILSLYFITSVKC